MTLKSLKSLITAIMLLPLLACAEAGSGESGEENKQSANVAQYKAGEHYIVLPEAVKTSNPNKIEVVEVFWYGCSHCYSFESVVQKWHKNLADDVDFRQMPAMWRDNMVIHARAFYTAQVLKKLDMLHQPLFEALNVARNPLASEEAVGKLFAQQGVSAEDFSKAYKSFSVDSGVRLAEARARSYGITGTPELVVNGKYRVTGRSAGSQKGMLDIVDYLVDKERQAK